MTQGHSHDGGSHGHGAKAAPFAVESSGEANLLSHDALSAEKSSSDMELGAHSEGHVGDSHDHEHDHGHSHGDGGCSGHGHSGTHDPHDSDDSHHGHSHGSRLHINENMRAAFLHVLGDALGSIGVIISGLVIKFGSSPNRFLVDPLCSLLIVIIISYSAIPQLIRVTKVVMQFVPDDIDADALLKEVKQIDGVLDIHDFHIWQLDSMKVIATCHVTCKGISEFNHIIPLIKKTLHSFGVHSSSIQPELMQDPYCASFFESLTSSVTLDLDHLTYSTLAPT